MVWHIESHTTDFLQQGGDQLTQTLGKLSMSVPGQVHIVDLVKLTAVGVHEMDTQQLSGLCVFLGQLAGLLYAAPAHGSGHGGGFHPLADGRRSYDEYIGLVVAPTVNTEGFANQTLHA